MNHGHLEPSLNALAAGLETIGFGITRISVSSCRQKAFGQDLVGWRVSFDIDPTNETEAVEWFAWAINNDWARGAAMERAASLLVFGPFAPPPYVNRPSTSWMIDGNFFDETEVVSQIERLRQFLTGIALECRRFPAESR